MMIKPEAYKPQDPNELEKSMMRLFGPNWKTMTDEEKKKITNDPERIGKADAAANFMDTKGASERAKSFRLESERLKRGGGF